MQKIANSDAIAVRLQNICTDCSLCYDPAGRSKSARPKLGPINPDHVSPADRLGRERVKHVEKLELIIEL